MTLLNFNKMIDDNKLSAVYGYSFGKKYKILSLISEEPIEILQNETIVKISISKFKIKSYQKVIDVPILDLTFNLSKYIYNYEVEEID
ncbi:MAG: hypothetical protein ACLT40_06530 [Fusobacterium sp.]